MFAWGSDHHCAREGESLVALQTGAALARPFGEAARLRPVQRAVQRAAELKVQPAAQTVLVLSRRLRR